ncbi:MAG: glycosyltransferase [Bacteroidia bacterium]|nr:glycosyltransferase [Bacteroidia bacterium]
MQQQNFILSIITINYNNREGLIKTVKSVFSQTNRDFEYLVIDGGSDDGSVEFIHENKDKFNYWCSVNDNGVYDAQNKGIVKSKGKYMLFLNSGDTLYDVNVVNNFINNFHSSDKGIIYGNSNVIQENGNESILEPPSELTLDFWYRKTLNHQAVFIKKILFDTIGLYNITYKISADFEFLLKVFLFNKQLFQYYPKVICNYYEGGLSTTAENYELVLREKDDILKKHLNKEEFNSIKKNYLKTLPLKQRILLKIYDTPLINEVFRTVYPIFSKGARK